MSQSGMRVFAIGSNEADAIMKKYGVSLLQIEHAIHNIYQDTLQVKLGINDTGIIGSTNPACTEDNLIDLVMIPWVQVYETLGA